MYWNKLSFILSITDACYATLSDYNLPAEMSVRKRSASGGKKILKEKIVEIYESLFRGDQISIGNCNFWEEFFLLKPKMAALEGEIGKLQADQLAGMRENLNM